MLKNNLRLILHSKLTLICFSILLVVSLTYTFYDIYSLCSVEFRIVIDGGYIFDKPYAASSWSHFYKYFNAVLFLLVPLVLCFVFNQKESFLNICDIRTKRFRQYFYQSLSIAIVTAVIFFIVYFLSLSAYYLIMGFEMEPWKIAYHNEEIILYGNYTSLFDLQLFDHQYYFGYDFFWMDNGSYTYLFFILSGLLSTFLFLLFMMSTAMFACLFNHKIRIWAFIIFIYAFLFFGTSENIFSKISFDLILINSVFEFAADVFVNSVIGYSILTIILIFLFSISFIIIEKIKRIRMN